MEPVVVRQVTTVACDDITAVEELCLAAAREDGAEPLSEHVRLHLRHGGDRGSGQDDGDRHLLAVTRADLPRTGEHAQAGTPLVVGYAHLDPTDLVAGTAAEVVVHPRWRGLGIGRRLVQGAIEASPDGRLRLWAHGMHPAAQALAASLGFSEARRLEQWRRSLDDELPPVELPAGVLMRTFVPGQDEEAWLALNARAFADHPEQGAWTRHDLDVRLAESWFDPNGFLIAEEPGSQGVPRMVAFHWTKVHGGALPDPGSPHPHEPIGEVYVVGVDPSRQRGGLGRALTLAGLHWLRAHGPNQAMLYVEGDNEAAKSVYRSLGFRHYDTDVMYFRRHDRPAGLGPSSG